MKAIQLLSIFAVIILLSACSDPLNWPEAPLYTFEDTAPNTENYPQTREEAIQAIVGHYAHYDVVAYEDNSTETPLKTFTISYGFTEYFEENGKLYQQDRFVNSSYKINQSMLETVFDRSSVEAIKPKTQEVELNWNGEAWTIYRPESPALLGIKGDDLQPLSQDPDDPKLTDPDNDGHPGVTVKLIISKFIKGEIYITRREIYRNHLTLLADGRLAGYIEDFSEQFVIDANMKILRQQSNPIQFGGEGLNPVLLVPVDREIDTWEELERIRDDIFPPEPEFM